MALFGAQRGLRTRRPVGVVRGVLLVASLALALLLLGASPAAARNVTLVDDGGADDVPGAKDLNELTVDAAPAGSVLEVAWNWDAISVSGVVTGDACTLFDTNNDGNANRSLCVIWDGDASYVTTRLYICGDSAADRCPQGRRLLAQDNNGDGDLADPGEAVEGGPYASTCSLDTVPDTFGPRPNAEANTDLDTRASCSIALGDLGGTSAFLVNMCSYQGQVPSSGPIDCVVVPNSGFLTIVKDATPNDPTASFAFDLGAGQAANDGRTGFTVDGSGSVDLVGFAPGTGYDVAEVVPDGWLAAAASCVRSDDTPTGTGGADTVMDVEIQTGRLTTCTFANSGLANLTLVKEVTNDDGGTAMASDWTLTADGADDNDLSGQGPTVGGTVRAGTFSLSESGPGGYDASGWVCDGGALDGDQLTLAAGDDVTCTITNDDVQPTLTVTKTVVNDDGGALTVADFPLFVDATSVESGVATGLAAGSYTVSETAVAGYAASQWGGDCAPDGSVTLALGDDKTCTITNDDIAPTLTLVKEVTNDDGGTAMASDWTLTADGSDGNGLSGQGPTVGGTVRAGTFSLSESGPGGYDASGWVCDGGALDGDQLTLAAGDDVTCTITNDDVRPTLTVTKTVVNDDGGTLGVADFPLFVDATSVESGVATGLAAGSYTVSETAVAGYAASQWGGDCAPDGSVTLAVGDVAECTITNDDVATRLTLVKEVTNDDGGTAMASDWTLTADGADDNDLSGQGPTAGGTVQAGTFALSESGPGGYDASGWACDGGAVDGDQLTLTAGDDVTCTITNDDIAPTLTLVKEVDNGANPGGTAVADDWTLSATAAAPDAGRNFSTPGGSGTPQTVVANAGYDLAESGPSGYRVSSDWSCDGGALSDTTIALGLGEDVTCTIANEALGGVELRKLTDGVESQTMVWNFTLTGAGVDEQDTSPPTTVDFGDAALEPGAPYTICETDVPTEWAPKWRVDSDGDGVPDKAIPIVDDIDDDPVDPTTGYSRVFDPNAASPPGPSMTLCVNFVVDVGQTLAFQIDNQLPTRPRRPVIYWRNWNTCTSQYLTQLAASRGGAAAGWFLLDDLLVDPGIKVGVLQLDADDCETAVDILDRRSIDDGRWRFTDGAYRLAAQLLAARVNLAAGAARCQRALTAVHDGQALLQTIGFDGTGSYVGDSRADDAPALAFELAIYNWGGVCG